MKQYKICALTPYYPPVKGGVSSYLLNLMSKLDELNFDTLVVTRYGKADKKTHVINQKIYFIIKSYFILCGYKPCIIHAHSNWYTLTPSVVYKLLNHKTRLIFTFHTEPTRSMKGLKKIIYQWLLSRCDVVTFVSLALRKKLEENFQIDTDKKVIYAGVSEYKVSTEETIEFRKKFSLKNNSPIISFVGPLVLKQKVEGVKILIQSFKIVKKRYPSAKLLIIGDGMYRETLEQLCEELDIYDVVFTGFLDNVFVPLKLSDIYAHITLQEGGLSISLLEAMIMGKTVIATKAGGIPEIIKNYENGILIEADPKLIGMTIINIYENRSKMKAIGDQAYTTVKKGYKWETIANNYIDIYTGKSL